MFRREPRRAEKLTLARLVRAISRRVEQMIQVERFRRFDPARHRDSWRSDDVARQMDELTREQLVHPELVAPYRAFRELVEPLLESETLPVPARFLDIGAGAGAYGELVERWWPRRFEYTGADFSEEIVLVARARWPSRVFVQKDIFDPGTLDGYDVVFASALLDVLADVERALEAFLAADARWAVLHRQRVDSARSRVAVVAGYRGQRTYSSYLTRRQLSAAAESHGRVITQEVVVERDVHSFVLERP